MEITVVLSKENETLPKAELLSRLETLDIKYTILLGILRYAFSSILIESVHRINSLLSIVSL